VPRRPLNRIGGSQGQRETNKNHTRDPPEARDKSHNNTQNHFSQGDHVPGLNISGADNGTEGGAEVGEQWVGYCNERVFELHNAPRFYCEPRCVPTLLMARMKLRLSKGSEEREKKQSGVVGRGSAGDSVGLDWISLGNTWASRNRLSP